MKALHKRWEGVRKPVIGMLHLLPLAGAPLFGGDSGKIREALVEDTKKLVEGGVDGLMMENFGDVPFYPGRVPASVVAQITAMAMEVRGVSDLPLGINVLRNDGLSALAIAQAVGADYVRVNVLSGARVTDQGVIQGIAHDLLRERTILAAQNIKIFADVDVKHSAALAERPIKDEVDDTLERGLADAVIVSGAGTGKATDAGKVRSVKQSAGDIPVFIGSGITAETVANYMDCADGFIVGSAFKKDGNANNRVEVKRVKELMKRVR